MTDRHEIWTVADAIQMDLRAASAKLVQLRSMLAALDLQEHPYERCGHCGVRLRPRALSEHLYVSHHGPVPQHWVDAERLAGDESETP